MFIDLIFGDRIWRLLSLWNKMVNEYFYILVLHVTDLEKCSSVGKESPCSAGDPGLIPGLGRSPGEGNGNLLQYPCLASLMDRGAWWAAVRGVAKSQARLND